MQILINENICVGTDCEYFDDTGVISYCIAPDKKDTLAGRCIIRKAYCPVPKKCPYKNLHIINPITTEAYECPCSRPFGIK